MLPFMMMGRKGGGGNDMMNALLMSQLGGNKSGGDPMLNAMLGMMGAINKMTKNPKAAIWQALSPI